MTVSFHNLFLVTKPIPQINQTMEHPNEGSSHTLTCMVDLPYGVSSSLVKVEWSGHRSLMSGDSRIIMSNLMESNSNNITQQYTKTVTFQQVQPTDNGNYICTVNVTGFVTNFDVIVVNGEYLRMCVTKGEIF